MVKFYTWCLILQSTGRAEGDFGSLEGDIITRNNQKVTVEGELNTLDEPIFDTIVSQIVHIVSWKLISNMSFSLFSRNET